LIPSRYHWDQLDAKVIVFDINFPVRLLDEEGIGWPMHLLGLWDRVDRFVVVPYQITAALAQPSLGGLLLLQGVPE
jgi:hypothetical protein